MAQKNEIFSQEVKHNGYFKFSSLYDFCFNWFGDEGFKVAEKKYEEKVSGGGKEIKVEWEASKKVTDYIKFEIKVDWHILGLKEAEIERDGKKENTNKGDLKMKFKGTFISDYDDQWEKKALWKFLRGMYDKYIVRTTLDEYKGKLISTSNDLVKNAKSFLQLEAK